MRVTQIQQTLPVDIIFVYSMPKVLGLLTLLAFVQVYHLKDNSGIDSVGPDSQGILVGTIVLRDQ